jgi:holliday junction DNA helicase RuvA
MIAFLKGTLEAKQDGVCLVDVNGVGYEVNMPASELDRLPPVGEPVTLFTWYLGREDGVQLFGFLTAESRRLFKLLLGISGIGPKSALAILSGLSRDDLARVVAQQDVQTLCRLPGIGRKTAERLLLELKDKLKITLVEPAAGAAPSGELGEALEALLALGYPVSQARAALQKATEQAAAPPGGADRAAEWVRLALRHL